MNTSEKPNKVCAVIPFYNEKATLLEVVSQTLKFIDHIILVDDGSNDNWQESTPLNQNITLLSHKINLGKGKALRTGLEKAISENFNSIITLDADLQHAPEMIPSFIENLKENDCVIGRRDKSNIKMPPHRKISNFLTSKMLSIKTGSNIQDSQSGFRAFKAEIIKNILPDFNGFEAESEMLVKLLKNKYSLKFIEIPTIYGNDNSKMKALPAIVGFIKVILKKF